MEGTDTYLYRHNSGGSSKSKRGDNMMARQWSIGEIIDGKEQPEFAFCAVFKAAFDWCPHRAHYCYPNHEQYGVEDMETDEMKKGKTFIWK